MQVRIRCIRNASRIGMAYVAGKDYTVHKSMSDELLELGFAIPLETNTELPKDFPGYRALYENGFTTFDELKQISTVDQLTEIKGIGEKLASQIVERLKK